MECGVFQSLLFPAVNHSVTNQDVYHNYVWLGKGYLSALTFDLYSWLICCEHVAMEIWWR